MADFRIERELQQIGIKFIAGIDEAGRGPLAGPVVASAVILDCNSSLFDEVNDSKKMNTNKRARLYNVIIENAICYSISVIDNKKIDEINILNATLLAMESSVMSLSQVPDYLLIDGNIYKDGSFRYRTIIKGDNISTSIAAASILAKVCRDNIMISIDKEYPQYNFAKHKGYPTKEHYESINKYGLCPYHRKNFLKSYFKTANTLF